MSSLKSKIPSKRPAEEETGSQSTTKRARRPRPRVVDSDDEEDIEPLSSTNIASAQEEKGPRVPLKDVTNTYGSTNPSAGE